MIRFVYSLLWYCFSSILEKDQLALIFPTRKIFYAQNVLKIIGMIEMQFKLFKISFVGSVAILIISPSTTTALAVQCVL